MTTIKRLSLWLILCLFGSFPILAEDEPDQLATKQRLAQQRLSDWQQLLVELKQSSDQQKLERVNRFFNSNILFLSDEALWKKPDYWATPKETLNIGGGDCEDYAIAKYMTLKKLGVDENKLRLTYVKAIELNQAHMVLTYFENKRATPLVLDNLITEIKPANQRQDLLPVYSFNGAGLWLSRPGGRQQAVNNGAGLSLWQDLLFRIQQGQ